MHTPVDNLTLSVADGEALIARVYQSNVSTADARLVEQVVRMLLWVVYALQEAKLSVKRLRALLLGAGGPPPSAPAASSPPDAPLVKGAITGEALAALPDGDAAGEDARPGPSGTEPSPKPQGGHRSGTGRLRAAAYTGAEHTECRHEELAVGQRCPVCGQGTLYALPPGVAMRIDGQALLSAIRYQLEKLRCSACGQICTARLPAGVGEEKDSPKARAVLAVGRYLLGLPCYRLDAYQAMLGVPVPDATQWDQIEQGGDCAYKVFEDMERQAAQDALLFHDDTAVRIVALIKEHSAILAAAQAHDVSTPKERTGMHTTALVVKVGEHTAILYDNWLRVLDTAELAQVHQRLCHQLHTIVALLNALKPHEEPLERIFPCKGPLDTHPQGMDGFVEEACASALGRLTVARILFDVGNQPGIEHTLPIVRSIKAAIEVEIGASQVHTDLLSHLLQRVQAFREQAHVRLMHGSHGEGSQAIALVVRDGDAFLALLVCVPPSPRCHPPLFRHGVGPVAMESREVEVWRRSEMSHAGEKRLPPRPIIGPFGKGSRDGGGVDGRCPMGVCGHGSTLPWHPRVAHRQEKVQKTMIAQWTLWATLGQRKVRQETCGALVFGPLPGYRRRCRLWRGEAHQALASWAAW